MTNRTRKAITVIQVSLAIIVALYAMDLGSEIMSDLYTQNTGSLTPMIGLTGWYPIGADFLAGFIPAISSYILLYNTRHTSRIVIAIILLIFFIYAAYPYAALKAELFTYPLPYAIMVGGGLVIAAYEAITKCLASNKAN